MLCCGVSSPTRHLEPLFVLDPLCRATYVQFIFADHTLDTVTRELTRSAVPVALEPQVFDLLVYLVENRERVVSKDDLLASVWHGRVVSESTLTSRINAARTAIGDSGRLQSLIRTVSRKGLRFIGEVNIEAGHA